MTCLDFPGGHKLHSYNACNLLQLLQMWTKFVKNHTGQMVRPLLPFCIPSKKDSLGFQGITAIIIFLQQVTKCDFPCSKLLLPKRFSMNILRTECSLTGKKWAFNPMGHKQGKYFLFHEHLENWMLTGVKFAFNLNDHTVTKNESNQSYTG